MNTGLSSFWGPVNDTLNDRRAAGLPAVGAAGGVLAESALVWDCPPMLILRDGEDWHTPDTQAYQTEGELQRLLAKSPELLPGDLGPLATARELGVATGRVDIGKDPELPPGYWVVPEWWMLNHIYVLHREGLAAHGGQRPRSPDSTHFAIFPKNVTEWRDRWDLLRIF